jgi:hypothetical protein
LIDLAIFVGDVGLHAARHGGEPLGLAGVDANHRADHGNVGLVAAEKTEQHRSVVGNTQTDAQILPGHVGKHLLRLGHDGLDELELDLDEHARQLHGRTREVVGAQFVARIGGLSAVHGGSIGKLRHESNEQRQRRDGHQHGHAALPIAPPARPKAPNQRRAQRGAGWRRGNGRWQ